MNAAIARAVVGVHRSYIGRGPTKSQAFFRDDTVVVLLEDVMTRADRTLDSRGLSDAWLEARRELHALMRGDLVEAIEDLTGCEVKAFMSDTQADPDMTAEVFVLDRPVRPTEGSL